MCRPLPCRFSQGDALLIACDDEVIVGRVSLKEGLSEDNRVPDGGYIFDGGEEMDYLSGRRHGG